MAKKGTKGDDARALASFQKACDGEIAEACNNLGLLYGLGRGTKQDKALAAKYIQRSCELGLDSKVCDALSDDAADSDGAQPAAD
jgi:TPR repeat protein